MYVLVETICSNLIVSVELWDLLELLDVEPLTVFDARPVFIYAGALKGG